MSEEQNLTIQETAQLIYNLMYGPKRKNLLDAYSYTLNKYKIQYSYEEIKDYLFHHELTVTC